MTIDYTDPFPDSDEDEKGEEESIEKKMDDTNGRGCFIYNDNYGNHINTCGTGTTFVLSSILVFLGLLLHWSIGRTLVI